VYQQSKQRVGLSTLKKVGQVVSELRHILREYKRLEAVIDHTFGKIGISEEVE
jgi:predicted AAA+ superfamily ATPase